MTALYIFIFWFGVNLAWIVFFCWLFRVGPFQPKGSAKRKPDAAAGDRS